MAEFRWSTWSGSTSGWPRNRRAIQRRGSARLHSGQAVAAFEKAFARISASRHCIGVASGADALT